MKRIRDEKKKRIVASIETVGASGAYYVSSATNKIYADNGSIVGSIGVIAEWVNYWAERNPKATTGRDCRLTTGARVPNIHITAGDDRGLHAPCWGADPMVFRLLREAG